MSFSGKFKCFVGYHHLVFVRRIPVVIDADDPFGWTKDWFLFECDRCHKEVYKDSTRYEETESTED